MNNVNDETDGDAPEHHFNSNSNNNNNNNSSSNNPAASQADATARLRATNVVDSLRDLMQIPTASTTDENFDGTDDIHVHGTVDSEEQQLETADAEHENEDELHGDGLRVMRRLRGLAALTMMNNNIFFNGSRQMQDEAGSVKCPLCNEIFRDYRDSNHPNAPCSRVQYENTRCSHGAMSLYTTLDQCPICCEEQIEPPNVVALACGHLVCKEDFVKLGGFVGTNAIRRPRGNPQPLPLPEEHNDGNSNEPGNEQGSFSPLPENWPYNNHNDHESSSGRSGLPPLTTRTTAHRRSEAEEESSSSSSSSLSSSFDDEEPPLLVARRGHDYSSSDDDDNNEDTAPCE
mmetsp:Transcript_23108/g.47096  ORF Transcript_23108/g.47096 Transcript_23108/m.47096 type:complete len:345 (+) Transcript_23108:284-1318(+)